MPEAPQSITKQEAVENHPALHNRPKRYSHPTNRKPRTRNLKDVKKKPAPGL